MSNKSKFIVTFLGTGTSQGVPVINCTCEVCLSLNLKDKRWRSSILIQIKDTVLIIDTGPDFRAQLLKYKSTRIDAVLNTHEHSDHVAGLDDLRPFCFAQGETIPIYGHPRSLKSILNRFDYAFKKNPYPGAPSLELKPIADSFYVNGIKIIPVPIMHGQLEIFGYRIGGFCYLTDMKAINNSSLELLKELDVLVINALHQKKHHSHLNLEEALEMIETIKPKKTYLTHLSHEMGLYTEISKKLPQNVVISFDGLVINI